MYDDVYIYAAVIGIFGLHWFISGTRYYLLALVTPAIWLGASGYFAFHGNMTSIRDWVMAFIGFLVLMIVWSDRHDAANTTAT